MYRKKYITPKSLTIFLIFITFLYPHPVSAQTNTKYIYDASGQRLAKIEEGGDHTYYISPGLEVVIKTDGTKVWRKSYNLPGNTNVVREGSSTDANGIPYYIHPDHLGSTSLVTDSDGSVVAKQRYYPYGNTRSTTGDLHTNREYTGQISDMDPIGLYYYNARYYDPLTAKFTQADTINDQLNRYAYVGNNPVNFNDPSGNTKNITMDTDWGEYLSRDTSSRRRMYTPYLSNNMAIQIAYIKTLDEIHYKGDTQYYQYFSMNYTPPNLVELNNNTDLANLVSFSRHTNEPFMLRKVAVPYLINFANAANEMGYTLHITDAYRSYSTQLDMFNINRLSENPVIMAGPGSSPHQSGFAVDLYIINKEGNRQGMPKELINIAQEYGLSQTNPADSPHFLIAGPFRGVSDTAFENLRLKGTGFVDTTYGWNQFLSHFVKEESKRYILPNNPKHLYR